MVQQAGSIFKGTLRPRFHHCQASFYQNGNSRMDEWSIDRIAEERNQTWNEAISAAADLLLARIKAAGRKPVIDELERSYEAIRALKR